MTQDTKKQFEKDLIQYGLKHNYIEKEKDGTLKFVGSKNQNKKEDFKSVKHKKTTSYKVRCNLDLAILLTDAILNEFEKYGICKIPLSGGITEQKENGVELDKPYSWELQDAILDQLEELAKEQMIDDNTKSIGE